MSTPPRRVRTAQQTTNEEALEQALSLAFAGLLMAAALYALVYMMIVLALTVVSILAVSFLVAALVGLYWRVRIIWTNWSRRHEHEQNLELMFGLPVDQYQENRRGWHRFDVVNSNFEGEPDPGFEEDFIRPEWDLPGTDEHPDTARSPEDEAFTFHGMADTDPQEARHG